jgi:hypothetical protein
MRKMKRIREIRAELADVAKRGNEGEIYHRISNFTIPAMQALGFLLALAVVYGYIINGDEIFRYWRVFFLNL